MTHTAILEDLCPGASPVHLDILSRLFDIEGYRAYARGRHPTAGQAIEDYLGDREAWMSFDPNALFDAKHYLDANPDVRDADVNPLLHYVTFGAAEHRDPHPLFSTRHYAERNPCSTDTDDNPLLHFLEHGARLNADPHPLFDMEWYRRVQAGRIPDGMNPLVHFIRHGAAEDRDPHPLFSTSHYRKQASLSDRTNPLVHFVTTPPTTRCDPHPLYDRRFYEAGSASAAESGDAFLHYVSGIDTTHAPHILFDETWYRRRDPGRGAHGRAGLVHYLRDGAADGLDPHPLFSTSWYLERNDHQREIRHNALVDYVVSDNARLGDPCALFCSAYYLKRHDDVAKAGVNPLVHFLSSGGREGRTPSRAFDMAWYGRRYADQLAPGTNPLLNFMLQGPEELRDPHADFDSSYYRVANGLSARDAPIPYLHYLAKGKNAGLATSPVPRVPADYQRPEGLAWQESFRERQAARFAAAAAYDRSPPFAGTKPTFTIVTRVRSIEEAECSPLFRGLSEQIFRDFEWVLVCSSTSESVRRQAFTDTTGERIRTRLVAASSDAGGSIGPERDHCGHYLIALAPSAVIYPDSLALIANRLRAIEGPKPDIVFGDEHVVDEDGHPLALLDYRDIRLATVLATEDCPRTLAVASSANIFADLDDATTSNRQVLLDIATQGGSISRIPDVLFGVEDRAARPTDAGREASLHHAYLASARRKPSGGVLLTCFDLDVSRGPPRRRPDVLPRIDIDIVLTNRGEASRTLVALVEAISRLPGRKRVLATRPRGTDGVDPAIDWTVVPSDDNLIDEINAVRRDSFAKIVLSSEITLVDPSGLIQGIGLLELDATVGVVGGPVHLANGMVVGHGLVAGLDGFVGAPFYGWPSGKVPRQCTAVRDVAAVPLLAVCVRAQLLRDGCLIEGVDEDDSLAGIAFCLEAKRRGFATLSEPALAVRAERKLMRFPGAGSSRRLRLQAEYAAELSPDTLSPHLSRRADYFGSLPPREERDAIARHRTIEIPPATALNLRPSLDLVEHPTINLLIPGVRASALSGGPNTAFNIGYRLAALGFAVRILSTDVPCDDDLAPIWTHILNLAGAKERLPNLTIVEACDRSRPVDIGANDIFFATAWWTAQMAHAARDLVGGKPMIYLIQDFEALFYPASSTYALAVQTYGYAHVPVINTSLLRDFLIANRIGRFGAAEHRDAAMTFEPAIDREFFHPQPRKAQKRRLLFYARPKLAARNLFEIGVAALRSAVAEHLIDPETWEVVGMGDTFPAIDLGGGATLECAPWLGFDGYAEFMRTSDILLSLMMSPHPSYPPLEMAGCGGLVVTNVFANKDAEHLARISRNIIAVEPTVEAVVQALRRALLRLDDVQARVKASELALPSSWDESFADIMPKLATRIRELGVPSDAAGRRPVGEPRALKIPKAELGSAYEAVLKAALARRAVSNAGPQETGLFTFVTTVWNTAPAYLAVLMTSLERQLGGTQFEWFILDNGSGRADTRAWLEQAARRPFVRLTRVEANLGIIGGMRYCLERAGGRYILPLDSDDYLYPDCVRTLAWYVQKHGYPALLYTDEDKLVGERLSTPFGKPDWDPVLFSAQCYIAHLCVIDRVLALELGAYSDPRPEGSHDWDTFTRFHVAGYVPVHVPHVLYSWRLHPQSTAGGNMASKPVVFASQRAVMERFLAGSPHPGRFALCPSPLFDGTPDWWLRRERRDGRPITTIRVRARSDAAPPRDIKLADGLDHREREMPLEDGLPGLRMLVAEAAATGRLVHVIATEVQPDDDEWAWEAIGLFDLFPDTVAVGGRIYSHGTVLEAGRFFGFGDGCGCPDRGRPMTDPGYSAQMWKPRSVDAVSAMHAVFDAAFLLTAIDAAAADFGSLAALGTWAGAQAHRDGRRVVYSPFLSAWTAIDWDALVPAGERDRFVAAHIDLMRGSGLRPANTGTTRETAYAPALPPLDDGPPPAAAMPPYADWIASVEARRLADRREDAVRPPESGDEPLFSLLTTLYIKTDAALFDLTACSVLNQTHDGFEWVVLTHGPITPELETVLAAVRDDPRVRLLRLRDNLGIVGGMRHVLEAARGTYVVPLDGDDLLCPDALALFASAIAREGSPGLLFTDEDIVIGERRMHPYLRPAWDPVLDLETSWIWHLCALKRRRALELGVYGDRGAEYCHDWDSTDRFAAAGERLVHVPHIAYSWRHHERSTSNTDGPNALSGRSVQHVLQRKIDRLGLVDRAVVAPYPIWRGAEEYGIARRPLDLPPLRALLEGDAPPLPLFESRGMPAFGSAELRDALAGAAPDTIVAFVGRGISGIAQIAALEVVKLFECVPNLAVVTGRVSFDATIASAGHVVDASGDLLPNHRGRGVEDAGPFALAWKAHSIAAPSPDLFFARWPFLRRALEAMPGHVTRREIGLWLGAAAAAAGARVAFSPLAAAVSDAAPAIDDVSSTRLAWTRFCTECGVDVAGRQGAAGYAVPRWR